MKTLFSVNSAALLIEKDRRTLVAALRGLKPDGFEGRQKRYKLKTLFDALLRHEMRAVGIGGSANKITDEHAALARARRQKVEMELAERAGRLVDAETMGDLLEKENRNVSERLLGIAVQVSDKIEPTDVERREHVRRLIEVAVHEALLELSAPADLLEQTATGRDRRGSRGNGGLPQDDDDGRVSE
jgi:phage terminase Nu1 subunit (DNA packaging protein)